MQDDAQNIIPLYRRHAAAWARLRGQTVIEGKWLDAFLNLLPHSPTILDVGCGSGAPIGRYLQDQGVTLTGIDTSPELIDIARTQLAPCTLRIADMRTLDLKAKFDGIIAWDSSFHLTAQDQRTLFPIFRKHAAPNAALMFTSGPQHGEAIGTFEGDPLYHASLDPSEYRYLLDQNGFEVMSHIAEDPECGDHTVWLARLKADA